MRILVLILTVLTGLKTFIGAVGFIGAIGFIGAVGIADLGINNASATPAKASEPPEHRLLGSVLWFQPSQVIVEGTFLIENGEVEKGMEMIRSEMVHELAYADLFSATNNLCVGHLLLKEYEKALKVCSKAIKLKPEMWQGYNNRANALFGMGDYAGAVPDYEKALSLNPESIDVQGNLALAERYLQKSGAVSF